MVTLLVNRIHTLEVDGIMAGFPNPLLLSALDSPHIAVYHRSRTGLALMWGFPTLPARFSEEIYPTPGKLFWAGLVNTATGIAVNVRL